MNTTSPSKRFVCFLDGKQRSTILYLKGGYYGGYRGKNNLIEDETMSRYESPCW